MPYSSDKLKKIFVVFLIIVLMVFIIRHFKNEILKRGVCLGISQVTGTKVTIGSLKLDILKQKIEISDLKIFNPQGFPKEVFLHCPEIDAEYDVPALLKKKDLHVLSIIVDLRELVVMRNKEGKLNVENLKFMQSKGGEKPFETMRIDMLSLSIGRAIYKDLSLGGSPQVFYLNIKDKTFHDINSASKLAMVILWEGLKSTTIKTAAIAAVASKFGYGSVVMGVVNNLLASDEASIDFNKEYDQVFDVSLKVIEAMGVTKEQSKSSGLIKANVEGADVVIKVSRLTNNRVNVVVSARKLLLPKPEVAGSVMYAIEEKLK